MKQIKSIDRINELLRDFTDSLESAKQKLQDCPGSLFAKGSVKQYEEYILELKMQREQLFTNKQ